jgi:hypothetical protein
MSMYGWSIIVNFKCDKNKEDDDKDIKNNVA